MSCYWKTESPLVSVKHTRVLLMSSLSTHTVVSLSALGPRPGAVRGLTGKRRRSDAPLLVRPETTTFPPGPRPRTQRPERTEHLPFLACDRVLIVDGWRSGRGPCVLTQQALNPGPLPPPERPPSSVLHPILPTLNRK